MCVQHQLGLVTHLLTNEDGKRSPRPSFFDTNFLLLGQDPWRLRSPFNEGFVSPKRTSGLFCCEPWPLASRHLANISWLTCCPYACGWVEDVHYIAFEGYSAPLLPWSSTASLRDALRCRNPPFPPASGFTPFR